MNSCGWNTNLQQGTISGDGSRSGTAQRRPRTAHRNTQTNQKSTIRPGPDLCIKKPKRESVRRSAVRRRRGFAEGEGAGARIRRGDEDGGGERAEKERGTYCLPPWVPPPRRAPPFAVDADSPRNRRGIAEGEGAGARRRGEPTGEEENGAMEFICTVPKIWKVPPCPLRAPQVRVHGKNCFRAHRRIAIARSSAWPRDLPHRSRL